MALTGSLDIMPLAELFQWVETHTKSGILEISHGRTQVGRSTSRWVVKPGRTPGETAGGTDRNMLRYSR